MTLFLASTSPRRKQILSSFGIPFDVISPQFDEDSHPFFGDGARYVLEIAEGKAQSCSLSDGDTLIAADTTVECGGRVIGKPTSFEHALEILQSLSGKIHLVHTGVAVKRNGKLVSGVETAQVHMRSLSREKLWQYVTRFSPLDKAGAYGIQDGGGLLVDSYKGCMYTIMGLPTRLCYDLLEKAGFDIWSHLSLD